eukprot:3258434-Rhodomonas_salina.1
MDRQRPWLRDDAPPAWEMCRATRSQRWDAGRQGGNCSAAAQVFTSAAIQQKAAWPSTLQMELEEDHVQPPA